MTYWGYHLIFTLPVLVILFHFASSRMKTAHWVCLLVTCVIAFLFTTPWDNYAAYLGIWGFGEDVSLWYPLRSLADRTPFLGHIPVEEYSFFIIQTVMVILLATLFLPKREKKG
ncbi:MAG: lycopene cyclase domain-containing protein [Opitutales bacterium]|nr:lycopene cyclase domain-containing protein [Opitutales bacterium]